MSEKVFELEAPEHVPRIEHDETWHGIRLFSRNSSSHTRSLT